MVEQRLQTGDLPRHRHATAYAAIVLAGGYVERGDTGRWRVEAGDIVAHRAFEAHGNLIAHQGAAVVNIPLPPEMLLPPVFRVADPDALIRAARSRPADAAALLQPIALMAPLIVDWPDLLASALRRGPIGIGDWATRMNLAPATVSRGFRAAFGITAARYRADIQAQVALRKIMAGQGGLAQIAQDCGFADQAHLSRAILALTGRTPTAWRKVKTVQDGAVRRS